MPEAEKSSSPRETHLRKSGEGRDVDEPQPGENMDRTLIIPIAIATAVHVGVLFGFHRGAPPKPNTFTGILLKSFVLPQEEPPKPDDVETLADETPLSREPPAPRSAEPFVQANIEAFEMPPVPAVDSHSAVASLRDVNLIAGEVGNIARHSILTGLMLDNPPRTRAQISPIYPSEARRSGMTGRVVVEFIVDEEGHVHDPRVMSSSDRVFEEPTLRAISRWRFEPGRKDGRVVRFRMAIPIEFNLNE
jgi:protein TonB